MVVLVVLILVEVVVELVSVDLHSLVLMIQQVGIILVATVELVLSLWHILNNYK